MYTVIYNFQWITSRCEKVIFTPTQRQFVRIRVPTITHYPGNDEKRRKIRRYLTYLRKMTHLCLAIGCHGNYRSLKWMKKTTGTYVWENK